MYYNPESLKMPPHRPPDFIPPYPDALKGTGKIFINQYMEMYIYVWLQSGLGFWMYPNHINEENVIGYVWLKDYWAYTKIPQEKIDCIY